MARVAARAFLDAEANASAAGLLARRLARFCWDADAGLDWGVEVLLDMAKADAEREGFGGLDGDGEVEEEEGGKRGGSERPRFPGVDGGSNVCRGAGAGIRVGGIFCCCREEGRRLDGVGVMLL